MTKPGGNELVEAVLRAGDREPAMQVELKRLATAARAGEISPKKFAIGAHRALARMWYDVERDPGPWDWREPFLNNLVDLAKGWRTAARRAARQPKPASRRKPAKRAPA